MEASQQRRLIHLFASSAVFTFFNYSQPETAAAFNHQPRLTRFRRRGHFYSLLPEKASEFKIIDQSGNDCDEGTLKTTGSISRKTTVEKHEQLTETDFSGAAL